MINPQTLSVEEVFYFTSLLHLWLARIHPFADGNGAWPVWWRVGF
ncbi:Fic family protein [Spirosoma litoris]